MFVTIVKPDNMVIINKKPLRVDLSFLTETFHALHWDGTVGIVETTDHKNLKIDKLDDYQAAIDAYNAKKDEIAAVQAKADANAAAYAVSSDGMLKRLTLKKREAEQAGVQWNGHTIDTSRPSQAQITSLYATRSILSPDGIMFKFANKDIVKITLEQLDEIVQTMRQHVQSCFDTEAQKMARILSLSQEDLKAQADEIINNEWPELQDLADS